MEQPSIPEKSTTSDTPGATDKPALVLPEADGVIEPAKINLLEHHEGPEPAAVAPIATPVAVAPPPHHRLWPVAATAVVIITLVAIAVGYLFVFRHKKTQVVKTAAKPTPMVSNMPMSPSPTPPASPSPSPSSAPAPQTVTAPSVMPTAEHPQTVTITNKSGLWLRSSPDSSNRNNIIGWMPNGAQVSVDQVGDFWWHGTYRGQAGYFASKFTQ